MRKIRVRLFGGVCNGESGLLDQFLFLLVIDRFSFGNSSSDDN